MNEQAGSRSSERPENWEAATERLMTPCTREKGRHGL